MHEQRELQPTQPDRHCSDGDFVRCGVYPKLSILDYVRSVCKVPAQGEGLHASAKLDVLER
jgi:hypothetical protein